VPVSAEAHVWRHRFDRSRGELHLQIGRGFWTPTAESAARLRPLEIASRRFTRTLMSGL
jgi:hypothetical protein